MSTLFLTKEARIHSGAKTASSKNGAGKTGYSHAKKWNWTFILHYTQESTQNGLKT